MYIFFFYLFIYIYIVRRNICMRTYTTYEISMHPKSIDLCLLNI